ncbi:RNA polymerase II associated protein 2 [Mortierella sp. AD011]|nr:RNA polymerase II associated protein 2 [Mortierella sp. AD010]KAF9402545.1 RNA polymerase II associated protein 2 [Mortierella sp. AD011]
MARRIVPTMKDDIVVDRSPLVDQYLPPKPKPKPSTAASSSSPSSSKDKSKSSEGLTKKQVLLQNNIALHKKYEAMVLDWTLILCDPVSEDTLGEAANRIKQSHYEEIIDERNIGNLCGYPLCSQPPRDLKGKFRISLSERKVFDISELKKYCSSKCLSASRWFESQLSEEPLYLMDSESAYLRTTRVSIVPLGMDITEFHAQRTKDAPMKEEKATPAFNLPPLSLPTLESAATSSTPSQKQPQSLGNEYVRSLLASVPETPSFIKIVERDTTGVTPLEDQHMNGEDSDDDEKENGHQYDSVEGYRIPIKPRSQRPLDSIEIARMSDSDAKTLEIKMSRVTLSDDQHMHLQDQSMSRTASSTSMDTRP